jgi:hypothetical protein
VSLRDMTLLFKVALGLLCLVAYAILPRATARLADRRFHLLITLLWIATRIGLFCAIYLVLRIPVGSDVRDYYYPEALHAKAGEVVYRDFSTNYAPAFPYLVAFVLRLWNSGAAIVLSTVIMEGAAFIVWLRAVRGMWPEPVYRRFAIFYVLSALVILNVGVAGQNQAWISLVLGTAVLLYRNRRCTLAAGVAGLSIVLVKFLPLLFIPAFLRRSSKPFRLAAAALLPSLAVYGVLFAKGLDVLQPVRTQGAEITCGNLPYLLTLFFSLRNEPAHTASTLFAILALGALSIYLLSLPSALTVRQIIFAMVVLATSCPLVYRKFYPAYLVIVWAPFSVVAALDPSLWSGLRLGMLNLAGSLDPSLWFRLVDDNQGHLELWQLVPLLRGSGGSGRLYVFGGIELVLLTFYVWYFLSAWKLLRDDACQEWKMRSRLPDVRGLRD